MKQQREKNFVYSYDEVEIHFQQPVLEFLVEGEWSSVQFSRSVVSDSLRLCESQHTRPPCPSPTLGVHPNSRSSEEGKIYLGKNSGT